MEVNDKSFDNIIKKNVALKLRLVKYFPEPKVLPKFVFVTANYLRQPCTF